MNYDLTNPYEIAKYIKDAKKVTPVKAYVNGDLSSVSSDTVKIFGDNSFYILVGDVADVNAILDAQKDKIKDSHMEYDRRNSAIPMLDIRETKARIEPGAIIRDRVQIGENAVIMMGAVINIGVEIGDETMIDMGAILGGRVKVGKRAHVGAGAVLAGVIEPPSATPVEIGDGALIGANAVVLEGVRVGVGAVVAAGAIVTEDVPDGAVVAGSPAKIVKMKDEKTEGKTEFLDDLRK
ncbi:MAG: 2,3,4,5-tetrahydropyridine-2,6-dicarboxylate N-acetyltransferase [Bacillota bacterium]